MKTILVVDDSPHVVDVLIKMLERGGYLPIKAYSGQECLNILKNVKTDLILLDIMMEPMDGWETLKHIKNNSDTKDILVFMLTAKPLTYDEAREYGMDIEDYLLKPVVPNELYDRIEKVLKRYSITEKTLNAAKKAGVDQSTIEEYANLNKSVNVNKRLLMILETTHTIHDSKSEKISRKIKDMGIKIRLQEDRLQLVQQEIDLFLKKRNK